jgi:tripartite ATP-independent transporter DctM subunit
MTALSKLVRKVPGRLSVITMAGGGIFAALSGSSLANTAMFGSLMLPEMERRGYSKELTTGSIIASGGLAMVIPPSNLIIMLGGIAEISVSKILIAAIVPGILLMALYFAYIIIACIRKPSLAPVSAEDETDELSTAVKVKTVFKDIVPLIFIFLVVIGTIFSGIGTATEAAAFGAVASYILAAAYKKFNFKLLTDTLIGSLKTTGMLMLIIGSSSGFSQVLSITGTSREAVIVVTSLIHSPTLVIFTMLAIVFILGLFLEEASIMMVSLPLFMPIVHAFGINDIWFAIMFLIILESGLFTPPVGMSLFVMKSVSPPSITMNHIIRGVVPFFIIDVAAALLVAVIPAIALFLPSYL